jgi:predicted Zn-dependent protease
MAATTEKELDERMRSYWLKAVAAIERSNFGYAIDLLQTLLKEEPRFLTGRQLLRRAEVARSKMIKKSLFNISSAPLAVMKAQRELKKDAPRAVQMLEKVLEDEPHHRQANLVLKEAALAAGLPETAVFALQTLLEAEPGDLEILHQLGRLHHELGENESEVEIYNRITEIDPLDSEALRLEKDASARASMASGGWTQAESYRDLIKDKELAVSLEQQTRMELHEETLNQQIAETYARHQAEPKNVEHARQLGALYEHREDFENAAAWYQYAAELRQGSDARLLRKVSDLQTRAREREIAEHEEFLAGHHPNEPCYAEREAALREAKRRRSTTLLEEARRRVERNPTDLHLRFELGQQLVQAGQFREALPELQRGRQNPNTRLQAMNLLGRSYHELGMLDLAAKQLEEAAREIAAMNTTKKEIVYNLGLVYAQMGEMEKSIERMKEIYEADYSYKDVAERVENSYRQTPSA